MKIGFIRSDDAEPTLTEMGYAEAGASEEEDEGSWSGWAFKVFMDFCIVYGIIAVVNDLIYYLRAW